MAAIGTTDCFLKFKDVSHEADLYDDWIFRSTSRYDYMHMFETDKSSQSCEWSGTSCDRKLTSCAH